jgi:ribosomal 50S subunit-recycling heat shock protein
MNETAVRRSKVRIDKFLKNARIIKRRTVAKEACEQGRVLVNGKTAKPGTEIEVGDEIEIIFGSKPMKIKAEKLLEHVIKDDYKEMYSILNV